MRGTACRALGLILLIASLLAIGVRGSVALADDGTPTPTATTAALAEPSATPTPTPTATPRPTATLPAAQPAPTPRRERPAQAVKKRRHHGPKRVRPTPTTTPTPVVQSRRHKRHKKRAKHPRPTPTPTATRVPSLTLNTEDSILPIQCDPSVKYSVSAPLLVPPYHGWTSIVSYFDHDMPSFSQDGLIVTATGVQAAPDGTHNRTDFPAYWNASIRQYLYYDGHNGYDFDLWYQPVYAAAAGKVIFAAYEYPTMPDHGYGKMVMIQHRSGYVTLYGHFSKFLVKQGQKVRQGQEIGISGNTGHSTGPHLHFTVFHNCNLTDPYGWTGSGPDPLESYQGETSSYLWRRAPEVLNPLDGWPGMHRLPPTSIERILLLQLPSTDRGTTAFTEALKQEAARVRAALAGYGGTVSVDLLQGALDVRSPVPFGRLYALPDVVSITTPDTIEGDKEDVLAALARAALIRPHPAVPLGRSRRWSGFLMQWQGRTLLVGRGEKGKAVDLRLPSGKGGPQLETLNADPKTGAYVIDLGRLSSSQRQRLDRTLRSAARSGTALRAHKRTGAGASRPGRTRPISAHQSTGFPLGPALAVVLLVLAGGLGFLGWSRRQRADSANRP